MDNQKPTPPTPEELKMHEDEMTAFITEKLPFLRLKSEYDLLTADIAEARIRTMRANQIFMQMKMEEADAKKDVPTANSTDNGNKG